MTHENDLPFFKRFWIYQKERFPIFLNCISVTVFTFSAVSYSRICRGETGFIDYGHFTIGAFAVLTLFLLVRIFDEHKDKVEDAEFRSYLPVPRGLMSLKELRYIGIVVGAIQIAVIVFFQWEMAWLYFMVIAYLCLMGVEFFIPKYLKKRQMLYITSHMFIIPIIDLYSSGLDWRLGNVEPHMGLVYFFIVSYMNGMVLEFGRKIRTPETEEVGVVSYTGLYGTKGGTIYWMLLLFATYILANMATSYAGYGSTGFIVLTIIFVISIIPGFLFLRNHTKKLTKLIEISSAVWMVFMYLTLGAVPMINSLFFS